MFRAMLALLQGRMAEHDEAVAEAQRLAEDHGEGMWSTTRIGHAMIASWIRGDVETIERERLAFASFASIPNQSEYPWHRALVHLWLGEEAAARAILASHPVGQLIVDHHLPGHLAWAAELAWRLNDRELAAAVYPWARREDPPLPALHIHGFAVVPPTAMNAMLCAATLGDLEAARRHFTSALQLVRTIGARPFEALLCHAFSQISSDPTEAAELAAQARALSDAMGMRFDLRAARPTPSSPAPRSLRMSCEGETWVLEGLGATCRLKASRGIEMLAKLVAEAGREVHVLDLMGAEAVDAGDSGEVLDAEARRAYRARMLELREELEEAQQWNDEARAERARDEIEVLEAELSRAAGIGGRERRVGKAAERARVNVQRRLADALKRIAEVSDELGKHLEKAIRTGSYCSYSPDRVTRAR
jgi:hypothetical protein